MSLEAGLKWLEDNWTDGEVLEGFKLLYPDDAVCFAPAKKHISKDGGSIKLAPFASLGTDLHSPKSWDAVDCLERRIVEMLLLNASAPAFPNNAHPHVYLKLELSGFKSCENDLTIWKPVKPFYTLVATQVSTGWLCYRVAKWYEKFLKYAEEEDFTRWPNPKRYYDLADAHLYHVILTEEEKDGLPVWKAVIGHGNQNHLTG